MTCKRCDGRKYTYDDGIGIPCKVCAAQSAPQSDEVKEAWQKFEEWTQAYPLSSFPEPDLKRCRKLLEDGGESLDRVSASNMRHVLEGLKRILEPVRAQSAPVDLERALDSTLKELWDERHSSQSEESFNDEFSEERAALTTIRQLARGKE